MSGRRCKALRARFVRIFGRPPSRATVVRGRVFFSEWRRAKKAHTMLVRSGLRG